MIKFIEYNLRRLVGVLMIVVMYIGYPSYVIVLLLNQLIVKRISNKLYYDLNDKIYETYHSVLFFYLQFFAKVQIRIYGDIQKVLNSRSDNILCLCNHQCAVDFMNIQYLLHRLGKMSRVRYITKEPFQHIPLIGYTFVMHSCLYVKSGKGPNSELKHLTKTLVHLKDNDIPSWISLFPEGTFYDQKYTDVIAKGVDYCKKLGVEPFNNLLTPRSRAFKEISKHFGSKLEGILDMTIIYPHTRGKGGSRLSSPSVTEYLGGVFTKAEIHFRLIDMKDFPENEDDLENWLFDLYRNKDKLLDEYYSTNKTVAELFNCESGEEYRCNQIYLFIIHTILISFILFFFFIPNGLLIYISLYFTLLTICTIHLNIIFSDS